MFEKIYVLPPMDDSAKEAYGSIERMHIIPMMFLHTKAAKLASCTLMNTVPVWSEIVERVNYVDRYLYALFRYWSPNVKIIFGVSEELKVDLENSATFWKNIFFPARKGLISIPRLIYRVVEYRMPVGNEFRLYNIAIIIHNNPSDAVSDKKRLCPVPTYGWEDIRNDDPEKGLSYACAMVPSINMRLGAYDKYDFPKGYHGTLQLVIMPVVKNGDYSGHVDVRGDIMNKMKELFPDQDIPQT
ncbi:uncharacterized protein LOC135833700 [Planococcus citri]|uniref:uncharacterized protein LOC135833700 n=1 Tax=Planococcus citri TaxID=170843 RepID=UPI0031F98317